MADIINFSGGMQDLTTDFLRKDNEVKFAKNVHFDNVGAITKRRGFGCVFTGDTAATPWGRAVFKELNSSNANIVWRVLANGKIQWINEQTTATGTSYTFGNSVTTAEIVKFVGELFIVTDHSGNSNINISGTTATTTHNLTDAPKGTHIAVYKDQLYLVSNSDRHLTYSSIPDASLAITWPAANYEVLTDGITAIHTNEALNVLLVFTESALYSWDGSTMRYVYNTGTTYPKTVRTVNGITYFFSKGKGVYAYDGVKPLLISRAVDAWCSSTAYAAGTHQNKAYLLQMRKDKYGDVTYPILRYNVFDKTWTTYTLGGGIVATDFSNGFDGYYTTNPEYTYFIDLTDGRVLKMANDDEGEDVAGCISTGGHNTYSDADDGETITSQVQTKAYDLGHPTEKIFVDKGIIYTSPAGALTGRVRYKGKDWASWFPVNKPTEIVNINSKDGRFVEFEFSDAEWGGFAIEGLSFDPIITSRYT